MHAEVPALGLYEPRPTIICAGWSQVGAMRRRTRSEQMWSASPHEADSDGSLRDVAEGTNNRQSPFRIGAELSYVHALAASALLVAPRAPRQAA